MIITEPKRVRKVGKAFRKHIPHIESVIFIESSYFFGPNNPKKTIVHFKENQAVYAFHNRDYQKFIKQKKMTKARFLEGIKALHIEDWDREYENIDVMDGEQWELIFHCSDLRRPIKIVGDNDFPPTFKKLQQLMKIDLNNKA